MFKVARYLNIIQAITCRFFLCSGLMLILFISLGRAQSSTSGTTPLSLTPGAPAGAYALSDFENVNLFNGNLNFHLPLLVVSGRGEAQIPMLLKIEQKWRIELLPPNQTAYPTYNWWTLQNPGYGPGVLQARMAVEGDQENGSTGEHFPVKSLLRLTFTAPDGTELELRDVDTGGEPKPVDGQSGFPPDGGRYFLRGSVFTTADGSAATFISCQRNGALIPLHDDDTQYPSGYLMLRDGTRYRIDAGLVSWSRDRNGNRLTYEYEFINPNGYTEGRVTKITDSLNRYVTIEYDVNDGSPYGLCDKITYRGFGGIPRITRVSKDYLSSVLRSDFPHTRFYSNLFPELNGASSASRHDPLMFSAVWMPDGRKYSFSYNPYGELSRVVLPTGGAIEYDWATGIQYPTNPNYSGVWRDNIYRRVIEKRSYPDGGTGLNFEIKATYSRPESYDGLVTVTNAGYVQTDQYSQSLVRLSRTKHYFNGYASYNPFIYEEAPFGRIYYQPWSWGKEYKSEILDPTNNSTTILRTTETHFIQRDEVSWWTGLASEEPENDPRVDWTTTTLSDVTPNLTLKQSFDYDAYNNRTDVWEYDFGTPGALIRHTKTQYLTSGYDVVAGPPTSPNVGATVHIRNLPISQAIYSDAATANKIAETTYEYDKYNQIPGETDVFHASLTPRSGITGLDSISTTSYYTRGNVTKVSQWLNTGDPVNAYMQYDVAGNVVKSLDPRSTTSNIIATSIDFNDRFGSPDDEAQSNNLPINHELDPDLKTFAFATKITNPLNQTSYTQYDYYLGKPVNNEDANGLVVKALYGGYEDNTYTDALDRATEMVVGYYPANPSISLQRRTRFHYDDANRLITTTNDQSSFGDAALKTEIFYDKLGRTVESRQYIPGGNVIKSTQTYDALGRVSRTYNPTQTGNEDTYGYQEMAYDNLSRVISVTAKDKIGNPTGTLLTNYSGNFTTITDQAGKKRRSKTDGLGRVILVDEFNADGSTVYASTSYTYDRLNNLVKVQQGGSGGQSRYFLYDSLKRLLRTFIPEQDINTHLDPLTDPITQNNQWNTQYTYDVASNLKTKIDPRNITTNFDYDALNRVTQKSYTGDPQSTPLVNYTYENSQIAFSKGRLTKVSNSISTYDFNEFDALGRVKKSTQTTSGTGQAYEMFYDYNLAGELTYQKYPSGREIFTNFDTAGRITLLEGQRINTGETRKTYASNFLYTTHGAVASMKLGTTAPLYEHTTFNSRLQPTQIGLGTSPTDSSALQLDYTYGVRDANGNLNTEKNNGNVESQTLTAPKTPQAGGGNLVLTQFYTYDQCNRLLTAVEKLGTTQQWKQSFVYDPFGNRTFAGDTTLDVMSSNIGFAANTTTNRIITSGYHYDLAGNLDQEPTSKIYTYDAENHQLSFDNGAVTRYDYDGSGKRVKKQNPNGGPTIVYVYNAMGQMIAEYTSGTPTSNGTSYIMADHLGSTRVVTKSDGSVRARYDYLPFGEELTLNRSSVANYGGMDTTRQKFTGYERDEESKLDFAQARYSSSVMGRFMSPDPLLSSADALQPQSWNRYVYTLNNPLNMIDPDGLEGVWAAYTNDKGVTYYTWFENAATAKYLGLKIISPNDHIYYQDRSNGKWIGLASHGPNPNGTTQAERQGWDHYDTEAQAFYRSHNTQGDHYLNGQGATIDLFLMGEGVVRFAASIGRLASGSINFVRGGTATNSITGGGAAEGSGSALVRYMKIAGDDHFTIEVQHGTQALETEMVQAGKIAFIQKASGNPVPLKTFKFAVPEAKSAMQLQESLVGTMRGPYNPRTNSCLTHCTDVLRAGGVEVPKGFSATVKFFRGLQ